MESAIRDDAYSIELSKSVDGNNEPKRRIFDMKPLEMGGDIIHRLLA